jgi:hypothetical protein
MNDPEIQHTPAELSEQVAVLQRQSFVLHLVLMLVSGTMVFFLCYQAHVVSSNLDNFRLQTQQMIKSYDGLNHAGINAFANQITTYAIAHPEFQPVLKKYGFVPPLAAAPPARPAPAAPKK